VTDEITIVALAQVDLRAGAADARGLVALPESPNTWSPDGGREVLWLGPDEWLFVGPSGSATAIAGDLDARLGGRHRSIVDVGANRTVFELTGTGRHDLLAKGCGLDLHPRAWRAGMCAQTILARVPVILQEREAATRVFVRPSYVGYLEAWFAVAGT
jgi:sarcosine oxidase, subunit gamma